MEGVYQLTLTIIDGKLSSNQKTSPHKDVFVKFVEGVVQFISQHDSPGELSLTRYATCKLILDDWKVTLCATSKYGLDGQWYNWCLVAWQDFDKHIQPAYKVSLSSIFLLWNAIIEKQQCTLS